VALETKWLTTFLNCVKGSHVQSQSEDSKNFQAEQMCCNTKQKTNFVQWNLPQTT
jgi:hypothetical protein